MAYEAEAIEVSEGTANRISFTENAKTNEAQLVRGWKKVTDTRKQSVLDYLKTRTYIDSPKYDNGKATASGRWRVANSGWDPQFEMYVETLRLGWATSLLTIVPAEGEIAEHSIPNDEVMLAQGVDIRSTERKLVLLWRNVASESVQSCVNEIRAQAFFDNPIVQGEEKTGRYYIGGITPQQQADGSYFIQVSTTRVKTTTPEADCKLDGEVRFNQSGKLALTRFWPCIDPSLADDLIRVNANDKMLAEVVTDPIADGKTYAGDWLALKTYKQATEEDGIRIVQELIKAGDQKLYTITGESRFQKVYEFQLWDASVDAVEAFLADSDPFEDASLDPKWAIEEVGIAKKVVKESNADRSINLHATYTQYLAWKSPNNTLWTAFKTVSNFNGIYTESVLPFRNQLQTDFPTLNAGEMIKAVENQVALFDGSIIKREMVQDGDSNKTFVTVKSAIYEWDVDKGDFRIPIWTSFTDSDKPAKITGYNVFQYRLYSKRTMTVEITRQFFNSHPSLSGTPESSAGSAGGGVGTIVQVIDLGEGLYAMETKTVTVGDWVVVTPYTILPLYSTTA